ncbi:hypothetical protein FJ423_13425 [Mesorhizobium sp. B2-8-9]|nr:hypothetical protein FJ423_13425 [Mesorhizobium sp. B2-8-9]
MSPKSAQRFWENDMHRNSLHVAQKCASGFGKRHAPRRRTRPLTRGHIHVLRGRRPIIRRFLGAQRWATHALAATGGRQGNEPAKHDRFCAVRR